MFTSTDADNQDYFKKNYGELKNTRNSELCSQHLRKENPSKQDTSHVSNTLNNEDVFKRDKNFDSIFDKYYVNYNKNVCFKNYKINKNVCWNDLNNSVYDFNKNSYEGYPPSFINPIHITNKYFDYENILMKVNYLLNDKTYCSSQNIEINRLGQQVKLDSHAMKAHIMRGVVGRNSPMDLHTNTNCFSSTKACRREGGPLINLSQL